MNYTEAEKRSEAELAGMLAFFEAAGRNLTEQDVKAYSAGWRSSFNAAWRLIHQQNVSLSLMELAHRTAMSLLDQQRGGV